MLERGKMLEILKMIEQGKMTNYLAEVCNDMILLMSFLLTMQHLVFLVLIRKKLEDIISISACRSNKSMFPQSTSF